MLKELIKLANELDRRGLVREASDVDESIKQFLERGGTIEHKDEGKGLSDIDFFRREHERSKEKYKKDNPGMVPDDFEDDVNTFVRDNFIKIKEEYSEDFQDAEDLYQSSGDRVGHQSLVEYFDSVLERAEMESENSIGYLGHLDSHDRLDKWISEVHKTLTRIAEEDESAVIGDVAQFFSQHARRTTLYREW